MRIRHQIYMQEILMSITFILLICSDEEVLSFLFLISDIIRLFCSAIMFSANLLCN